MSAHAAIREGARELRLAQARFRAAYERTRGGDYLHELELFYAAMERLPIGLDRCLAGINALEPWSVEYALCYLEVRPYFFRSQYLFTNLWRRVRRAPLTKAQRVRFDVVQLGVDERRERNREKPAWKRMLEPQPAKKWPE